MPKSPHHLPGPIPDNKSKKYRLLLGKIPLNKLPNYKHAECQYTSNNFTNKHLMDNNVEFI